MNLIIFNTAEADNLLNFEYSSQSLLFTYVDKSQIDTTFRYKNIINQRYELNYQMCEINCNGFGMGFGSHRFNLDKFSENTPQYVSYEVSTDYIYFSYRLSNTINSFIELGSNVNLGYENLVLSKKNSSNDKASISYLRIEGGGFAKYYFEPKLLYLQRIYIIGSASMYLKSVGDLNYDNQEFKKTELIGLNFLLTIGAGLSF